LSFFFWHQKMSSPVSGANFDFWSITIPKDSEKELRMVSDDVIYHVSNVTLGQGVSRGRTTVFCKANGQEAAICNLVANFKENAKLDLIVSYHMNASFITRGPNAVTLSGYIQPHIEDSDIDMMSSDECNESRALAVEKNSCVKINGEQLLISKPSEGDNMQTVVVKKKYTEIMVEKEVDNEFITDCIPAEKETTQISKAEVSATLEDKDSLKTLVIPSEKEEVCSIEDNDYIKKRKLDKVDPAELNVIPHKKRNVERIFKTCDNGFTKGTGEVKKKKIIDFVETSKNQKTKDVFEKCKAERLEENVIQDTKAEVMKKVGKSKNELWKFSSKDASKKRNKKVVNAKKGVRYRTIRKGHVGVKPAKWGDTITLIYIGQLSDGTQFEKNLKEGLTFKIGGKEVVAGVELGVIGMCPGEKRRIIIPPKHGYGKKGACEGKIPPNAELHFTVERKE